MADVDVTRSAVQKAMQSCVAAATEWQNATRKLKAQYDAAGSGWKDSKYKGMYVSIARWGNQPSIFKKMSFRQFCEANQELFKGSGLCAPMRAMTLFEKENPEIAKQYFDMRFDDYSLDNLDLR